MCCNNRLDIENIPVVDRWDYDEIMITGGEPSIFQNQVADLIGSIRCIQAAQGIKCKIYVYTAIASAWDAMVIIMLCDGAVVTPHNKADLKRFEQLNKWLLQNKNVTAKKSLRLNLFPEIKELLPADIDLSLWQIKEMQWQKDCPVPDGEDLRRINYLYQ